MNTVSKLCLVGLLILVIPFIPFAVSAQSNMQTVDLGDGYQITVPASWAVTRMFDGGYLIGDRVLTLTVITPVRLERLRFEFAENDDALDALSLVSVSFIGTSLERESLQAAAYGERLVAVYVDTEDPVSDQIRYMVPMRDGGFGYLKVAGPKADVAAFSTEMDAIITSFDVAGTAIAAPTSSSANVTCTVSASAANTGQLRVGPGENRSAIAFLPADTDVTVTGRAELDDGSVWFQLDKVEAAPQGTAAAELWVNDELVETSGDCDQVGETNAPPVIPISVAPPLGVTAAPGEPASGQYEGCDLAWFTFADGVIAGITSFDIAAVQSQRQMIESSPYPECASKAREMALYAYDAALASLDAFNFGSFDYASNFRSLMHDFLDYFAIEEYSLGAY